MMDRIFRINCLLFLGLLSAGCFTRTPGEEVQRVTSPDGLVDAVLTIVRRGSLNADNNYVFLVPKGREIRSEDPIVAFVHQVGLKMEWREAAVLQLSFRHAKVYEFRNSGNVRLSPDKIDFVEIQLHSEERSWLPDSAFKGVRQVQ